MAKNARHKGSPWSRLEVGLAVAIGVVLMVGAMGALRLRELSMKSAELRTLGVPGGGAHGSDSREHGAVPSNSARARNIDRSRGHDSHVMVQSENERARLTEGARATALAAAAARTEERRAQPVGHAAFPGSLPGLCSDPSNAAPNSSRSLYLAAFVSVKDAPTPLYVDRAVPEPPIDAAKAYMQWIPERARQFLGVESPPPVVYLHRNAELLRKNACVADAAVAYYDGAIHVSVGAGDPYDELARSLKHEYVHHVLFSHDVRTPLWFQEGAAIVFGGEPAWRHWRFKGPPIPLDQMVEGLPLDASPAFMESAYGQSYIMLTFLQQLCLQSRSVISDCSQHYLIEGLQQSASPETLFQWATTHWAGELGGSSQALLEEYVAQGYALDPRFTESLRRRMR